MTFNSWCFEVILIQILRTRLEMNHIMIIFFTTNSNTITCNQYLNCNSTWLTLQNTKWYCEMFVIVFIINNLSKHGTFCCSIKIFETHIFGTFLWCLFSLYIHTKMGISDVSLLGAVCDKRRCSLCSSRNLQGRLYDEPKEHLHSFGILVLVSTKNCNL